MAEPFKNLIAAPGVRRLATEITAVHPAFDAEAFVAGATRGLEPLELKARVAHVARVLRPLLPAAWPAAAAVLVGALPPPTGEDEVTGHFYLWPVLHVVEAFGVDDPDTSLPALQAMTQRWSAEFAIRPLLAAHPARTLRTLATWTDDPSVHVRRLVSEGARPRLPWGMRLQDAVRDPSPGLALLERLVDDPSAYVRRSVANHLGDVAKDHPDRALAVATRWWDPADPGAVSTRRPLVRHALRTLLKAGHPGALALVGHGSARLEVVGLAVSPSRASVGGHVEVVATIRSPAEAIARVDVQWSWPGARGGWCARTFRGGERSLGEGDAWAFRYRLPLRPVTTRQVRPGAQRVVLRVNGVDHGPVEFVLDG